MRPEEIFDIALALRKRAEKAEAEVERLRVELRSLQDRLSPQISGDERH
jgi:hypothetical protein